MQVPGSANALMLGGAKDYTIARSLRFRSSASAYLNRTPASAGNQQKFTWSGWVKLGLIADTTFVSLGTTLGVNLRFASSQLQSNILTVGSTTSTAVYRDPSAWYHVVLSIDTTQASNNNRLRLYVNGSEVSYSANATITQNSNLGANSTTFHVIGAEGRSGSASTFFDGYLTEVNFIDGQALTPSSFGETDATTGVWKAKKYAGTYGTNGFYLPFSDNTSTTTLGYDKSGNGNNWTTNNISLTAGSTYDSMVDVPTLSALSSNYAVVNPLVQSNNTIADGNLKVVSPASGNGKFVSSIAVNSGKFYMEFTASAWAGGTPIGIASNTTTQAYLGNADGSTSLGFFPSSTATNLYLNATLQSWSGSGNGWTASDVAGLALDATAKTISLYKNNGLLGTYDFSSLGWSDIYFAGGNYASATYYANFGQRPFTYTPPTGFVALNTFNLPEPSIKAGNKHFNIKTFTANNGIQTITGIGFQPSFVWTKSRANAYSNGLYDAVRGVNLRLRSDTTGAEVSQSNMLNSFDSDGFTLGASDDANYIGSSVAWAWKANGTGSSNTAGSITSTVSANPTAGFSVVTYTGTGANATVGHGLGVAPKMIILKSRSASATNWVTYHASLGATQYLFLNLTNAAASASTVFNNTAPTSSVFSLGSDGNANGNGNTNVAYCFSEVAGYSKFGSYTGNGSADGTFVHLGFRPRWILVKQSSAAGEGWKLYDTARSQYNLTDLALAPSDSAAEAVSGVNNFDILSNGFKARNTGAGTNANGATYIFMAFAENPFKYSLAR